MTTTAPGPIKIAASLHGDGHLQRQCPHCKKRAKCPGEGVRPECRERAILHVMMCHARDMSDAAHQALAAQIIAEDPNVNNFRTTQVAPGATPGPANWTEHSDSQWGWCLREYNRFKRMSAYSQRTAEKKLLDIVATVDGQLSRSSLRTTRQAMNNDLQLDTAFYDLWDYADGTHFYACWGYSDRTTSVKPPFPPPSP